jgi:hypothetical protein
MWIQDCGAYSRKSTRPSHVCPQHYYLASRQIGKRSNCGCLVPNSAGMDLLAVLAEINCNWCSIGLSFRRGLEALEKDTSDEK